MRRFTQKENASVSGKDMKKAEALGRQNMLVLMSAVWNESKPLSLVLV